MLSLFVDWATQPIGLVSLLMLLGVLSLAFSAFSRRFTCTLFVSATITFWVFSTPGFANMVIGKLEHARQNPAYCQQDLKRPVIVLGGGLHTFKPASSPYELLARDTLARVTRAAALGDDDTRYYLLGGGNAGGRSLAALMAEIMADQGYEADKLVIEASSLSTRENAIALQALLPLSGEKEITLVTSAMHVPRAAAAFEKVGYRVCHVPADALYAPSIMPVSVMPYVSGLVKSTYALREIAASVVYRVRGYA